MENSIINHSINKPLYEKKMKMMFGNFGFNWKIKLGYVEKLIFFKCYHILEVVKKAGV